LQCCINPGAAEQTILIFTSLNEPTRGTDSAQSWKSYFIGITKYTLNPVINFKGGIAHQASGFTLPGFYTLARTKRAV
jgi:hypothetical protein